MNCEFFSPTVQCCRTEGLLEHLPSCEYVTLCFLQCFLGSFYGLTAWLGHSLFLVGLIGPSLPITS